MQLGDFSDLFLNMQDDDFVFSQGFGNAHSYRGYYNEVAFTPEDDVTLREVKQAINSAFNDTHEGYKGGDYEYDSNTPAHLSYYGNYSDDSYLQLEAVIGKMLIQYYTSH